MDRAQRSELETSPRLPVLFTIIVSLLITASPPYLPRPRTDNGPFLTDPGPSSCQRPVDSLTGHILKSESQGLGGTNKYTCFTFSRTFYGLSTDEWQVFWNVTLLLFLDLVSGDPRETLSPDFQVQAREFGRPEVKEGRKALCPLLSGGSEALRGAIRPDSDLGQRQAPRCPGPTFALRLSCDGRADRSASGCCHTAEDEQTPSEQNVSVEVPQRNTKKTDLSSQKVCPWDMGNLALEGGLRGPEVLRTNPGQTLCGTDVKSHQHGGEKLMRRDLGCWHTAEDEQTPSEQNVSVEVPQRNTKKTDLSSQKVCPWDMGNLALEGGLCGPEVLRTNPGQTLCGTDVKSHQHGGETLMRRDLDGDRVTRLVNMHLRASYPTSEGFSFHPDDEAALEGNVQKRSGVEGSDRGRHGAALLTDKNLNQAFVGPQAPGFPLADPPP
ncbi:hypothetical protein E5288_WYG007421 [Bos mutus]|uniref:Uncharacterized protein n=1 Tax=Bos mutus TaxID=72004 RepID=A0A6B0SCQ6_9CETA|nr:hypothetical protein [Bos mutus]